MNRHKPEPQSDVQDTWKFQAFTGELFVKNNEQSQKQQQSGRHHRTQERSVYESLVARLRDVFEDHTQCEDKLGWHLSSVCWWLFLCFAKLM